MDVGMSSIQVYKVLKQERTTAATTLVSKEGHAAYPYISGCVDWSIQGYNGQYKWNNWSFVRSSAATDVGMLGKMCHAPPCLPVLLLL